MNRLAASSIHLSLATLAIASIPGWILFPVPIMLFSTMILVWRLLALRYQWRALPVWFKAAMVLAAMMLVYTSYGHIFGRQAATAVLLLMMSLKCLELFSRRDARVLLSLTVFLVATFFLFRQNPGMLIYAAAVLVLMLHSLSQLLLTTTDEFDSKSPKTTTPLFTSLMSAARLVLIALPLAALLFVVFPRLATPFWGINESALDGKTGLSEDMSPGSIQSLFMDDSPAFRVEFTGSKPANNELYWRGPVLWNFDGRRWTTLFSGYREMAPKELPTLSANSIAYQIQLEPSERRWLYALDYPVVRPADSHLTIDYQLVTEQAVTNTLSYRLVSEPKFSKTPVLMHTLRQLALDLPDAYNPKSVKWIETLRNKYPAGSERQLIQAVLDFFTQEEFYYSLNPPLLGRHSVDEFMFSSRSGYCEHYASTFTVLMRMAGIPARVVTGYQGGYYNNTGEYLLVRQSDAHAWSEVWLDSIGWLRIDPTSQVAPERILSGARAAIGEPRNWYDFNWLRELRNHTDLIQHFWNRWVIEFSASSQTSLLKALNLDQLDRRWLMWLLLLPVVLAIAIVVPLLLRFHAHRDKNPALHAYRQYLTRLKKAGFQFSASDSASQIAAALAAQISSTKPELRAVAVGAIEKIRQSWNRLYYSSDSISSEEFIVLVKNFMPDILAVKPIHKR